MAGKPDEKPDTGIEGGLVPVSNLGHKDINADKGCNGSHLNSCNNLLLSMIL